MDSTILSNMEKRVAELESKIVSTIPLEDFKVDKIKPVINALQEVDAVLISTLSGREKITSVLKRIDVLEKILEPSFLETSYNADLKIVSILESEAEVKYVSDTVARVEKLEPALNARTDDATANTDRLNNLMSNFLLLKEECKKQKIEAEELAKKCSESMVYLTNLFHELAASITQLEIESQPKKVLE